MTTPHRRGFHTTRATARSLPAAGGVLLAGAAETADRFTLIEAEVPPRDETPLHLHRHSDESFYVLAGRLTVTCGDDIFTAAAGDFVHLPQGVPHRYVAGDDGGRMLILATPGGLEGFFDDWEAGTSPAELERRHGIELLPGG